MLANIYSCRWNTFFRVSWFAIIKIGRKSIFASVLCRIRFGASLFGKILIYWLQYGKQFVKQRRWEGHNNIPFACIHKRRTFLIYVFELYDSLTETACKTFPPAVFVSDWLEFLIHIHSVHSIFAHFLLFVDEWRRVVKLRANFSPGGRRCFIFSMGKKWVQTISKKQWAKETFAETRKLYLWW